MRLLLAFLLLFLTLSVGMHAALAAKPAPDSDPLSLIEAIYATYTANNDNPGLSHVYSKRLQALVDKDEKETPEGEVGRIDWDVFIDGQDWKLTEAGEFKNFD